MRWPSWLRRRPPQGPPLAPEVQARVDDDFPPPLRPAVERELRRYTAREGRREPQRVQVAILDLVKREGRSLREVRRYTDAAIHDYRDVLYWAYYHDRDPFLPLSELLDELVAQHRLSAEDAFRIRNDPGVTAYRRVLLGLLDELTSRGIAVTAAQLQSLERIARLVKVPLRRVRTVRVEA